MAQVCNAVSTDDSSLLANGFCQRSKMPTSMSESSLTDYQAQQINKKDSSSREQMAPTITSKSQAQKLEKFYENKTILMTGVTGFIGKVCLVKLMHSLKSCGQVYVMLRPKKGMTPQQRFKKLISEEPFVPAPLENPNACPLFDDPNENKGISREQLRAIDWSRVTAVEGDMSLEDLGFADDIKEKMCKSVDIVFNIAASVQFDAPLKENLRDNYLGCENLLKLATKFEKLVSYVHVSTFYTNSHLSHIEEKVVPLERDCEEAADLIRKIPEAAMDKVAPSLMENRPNTYIYTKAMAENLVMKYEGKLPLAIVRPSIVMPSMVEPYPGWVDNVNGPMGLAVLASLGILRNIDWNYNGVADLIPVDYVVNSMFAVAERTPRVSPKEIKVYNCSTSSLNPVTWGKTFEELRAESMYCPPYKMLRMPIPVPTHKRASRIGWVFSTISELTFAFFVDFLLFLFGQKPILRKLTSKLHHAYAIMRPFTTTAYTCSNDNLLASYNELDPSDKKDFCFKPETIDWSKKFKHTIYAMRRRLTNEDPSTIPAAVRKMRIHIVVEFVFSALCYLLMGFVMYKLFTRISPYPVPSFS